jgi:hypothetical protein
MQAPRKRTKRKIAAARAPAKVQRRGAKKKPGYAD